MRKKLAFLVSFLLLISSFTFAQASVIEDFLDPPYTSKLMARLWFADGSAGLDDDDVIEETILALAEAGFGGVEVQYLADGSDYTNEQAQLYGWGSESWVLLLKKIFTVANSIEGGFRIDITGTAHWPPEINTIDPNDDAAATEMSMAITKITATDLANGSIELNLPTTKTADGDDANFIFTDTFIAANAAQVVSVADGVITLDYTTLTDSLSASAITYDDVSGLSEDEYREIDGVYYKGSAAGVPDEEYCEAMGWDYQDTLDAFGPEPAEDADLSASFNGKMDEDFNRARLADWQYVQSADISGLDIEADDSEEIAAGDWVIVATYYRGTGQVKSGGDTVTMYNRTYVPNYYDESGVEAISEYWWNYIIDDELEAMLRENGGSIFEDSIETSSESENWTADLLDELEKYLGEGYEYESVIAAIIGTTASTDTYTYTFDTADADTADLINRIEEDYSYLLNQLYLDEHIVAFNEFANSFGYTYRAQIGDANQFDAGAALDIDVVETDAANRSGITPVLFNDTNGILSKEAMAGFTAFSYTFEDIQIEFNSNFSWGYNRVIIHGCAYSKVLNGGADSDGDWPGYPPFGSSFGEPYGYRMVYWDSFDIVADQVASTQAILQSGQLKLDVLIMGEWDYADILTDYGYTYSLTGQDTTYRNNSESVLFADTAIVSNNVLQEDGAAYKGIIVSGIDCFSVEGMQKLYDFATEGLPIIFVNCDPSDVDGTYDDSTSPEAMIAIYEELITLDNVAVIDDSDTLLDIAYILGSLGVTSNASYEIENLEIALYEDEEDGSLYYYLYNSTTDNAVMPSSSIGTSFKTTDIVDEWITITGEGNVYFLDPLDKSVTQAAEYVDNGDGTISVHLDKLAAGDAIFIAVTNDTENYPEAVVYAENVSYEDTSSTTAAWMQTSPSTDTAAVSQDYALVRDEDGSLVLQAFSAGSFEIDLSDGTSASLSVAAAADVALESWSLVLGSWGPVNEDAADSYDPETGIQTVDPAESEYTDIDFGTQELGSWTNIEATAEQLEEMGVTGMNEVSGRGYYTTTFEWTDENAGAILTYSYSQGQITGITINGTTIDKIDNVDDQMDIGDYLVVGENTLTIEYSSTLNNRVRVENRSLTGLAEVEYGLTSAALVTYTTVNLGE